MKKICVALAFLCSAPAFAQAVSDDDLGKALSTCNQPGHFQEKLGGGIVYGPGWEGCAAIRAEATRRASEKDSQKPFINDLANRLKGAPQ